MRQRDALDNVSSQLRMLPSPSERQPRPRILFIARAYPPTVGGMENFAYQLGAHLRQHADVSLLINHGGKRALPAFLPYALASAIGTVRRGRIDVVHLADASLAPLGAALKLMTGVPVTASVCGLDITYPNPAYQALVPRALARLDMTMPISGATMAAMRQRTGSAHRSETIPLGVNPLPSPSARAARELERLLALPSGRPMLLTVGRLVERKGVAWFVRHVLSALPDDVAYVLIGEGPQREAIARAAREAAVSLRVHLLGRVSDELLAAAYARADVFVMPNVPVAGDLEGFGLVALEAAAVGLPVVASRLEGITEALQDGRNATLVPALDVAAYADALSGLISLPAADRRARGVVAATYTGERYGWERTAARYVEAMRLVLPDRRDDDVAGAAVERR